VALNAIFNVFQLDQIYGPPHEMQPLIVSTFTEEDESMLYPLSSDFIIYIITFYSSQQAFDKHNAQDGSAYKTEPNSKGGKITLSSKQRICQIWNQAVEIESKQRSFYQKMTNLGS